MFIVTESTSFRQIRRAIRDALLDTPPVDTGEWQAKVGSPEGVMSELHNVTFEWQMPRTVPEAQVAIQPQLPWADEHFAERTSGIPHNPPPSSARWLTTREGHFEHLVDGKFSHTYPERFWPKSFGRSGIRYAYGDLFDVMRLLSERRYTRQAFLPVWFPEDTGATAHQRVPCTLGYWFRVIPHSEGDRLHMTYYIRSCDYVRHFRDDVYLATRLAQWAAWYLDVGIGTLTMHIGSMHVFARDLPILRSAQRMDDGHP